MWINNKFKILQTIGEATEDIEFLVRQAIACAMDNRWQEAIRINQKILLVKKGDIEALNRLAQAYCRLGHSQKAQKNYKRVLEIDPFNLIAHKNLDKLTKSRGITNGHNGQTPPTNLTRIFLCEPGRTKLISLLNLAPPQILAGLNCGDRVILNPKKHAVTVTTIDGTYLGALADDLAHRLLYLITEGYQYEAYVKCATTKQLTVFIKETKRSPKFANQPSFQISPNQLHQEETFI